MLAAVAAACLTSSIPELKWPEGKGWVAKCPEGLIMISLSGDLENVKQVVKVDVSRATMMGEQEKAARQAALLPPKTNEALLTALTSFSWIHRQGYLARSLSWSLVDRDGKVICSVEIEQDMDDEKAGPQVKSADCAGMGKP